MKKTVQSIYLRVCFLILSTKGKLYARHVSNDRVFIPYFLSLSEERYSTDQAVGSEVNTYSPNHMKTTDYVGNKVYENGVLKRILTENGYYENGNYYFYVKNHQGSNVVVANRNGNVVQQTHYYPFGLTMGISDGQGAQPYKYTGKELDMEHGLMQYDFEARQYDPTVGRFMTMDPLAEKYYNISPYAYCLNNPVRYTDENGMEPGDENDPIELPEIVVTPKPTIQPGNQVLPAQSWWWNIWYFLAGTRHWTPSHPTLGRYGRQPVYEIWADGKVGQEKPPYTELTFTAPISTTPVSALRGIKDLSKFIKSIKDLRTLKSLVKDLSKPGSKLTQQELDELRTLVKQHGGQVRVDLTGIKGTGTTPHAHVEGLGSSLESRHIWLETGVK